MKRTRLGGGRVRSGPQATRRMYGNKLFWTACAQAEFRQKKTRDTWGARVFVWFAGGSALKRANPEGIFAHGFDRLCCGVGTGGGGEVRDLVVQSNRADFAAI